MASIKDVAKRAGVSVATVSRVINQAGNVKEKTKAEVEQAMEELHYYPNSLARALGKGRQSNIIALLSMAPRQPFFSELISYIEEALYEKGYRLLILTSEQDVVRDKKCTELVNSRIIDGLIIGSFPVVREMFLELSLPMVTVETYLSDTVPYVVSDNYQGGFLGARHLIARGCRNLVWINGSQSPLVKERKMDGRERGFLEVCQSSGVTYRCYHSDLEMIETMDYSRLADQIFTEFPEVDGILANSDVLAADMVRAGTALGYKVPERLKVIGFDGCRISRVVNPPLTVIAQDIEGLARQAVNIMIAQIEGGSYQMKTVLPVNLVERRTT